MSPFYEKFYIFIKSSFGEKEKKDLYNFIWKNYGRRISFYISSIVPFSHYCFEDLFQEVMLKIYNNLHTFNPLHSFKAWIYKIARFQCLDFVKNKEEKRNAQKETELGNIATDADPEKRIMKDELLAKIDQFVESLEPGDREICYLRFYENLGYRDISDIVNRNINSIKSKIRVIKSRLKSHLKM